MRPYEGSSARDGSGPIKMYAKAIIEFPKTETIEG
jgi:hypothetical protein